jgi:hypothetical protein
VRRSKRENAGGCEGDPFHGGGVPRKKLFSYAVLTRAKRKVEWQIAKKLSVCLIGKLERQRFADNKPKGVKEGANAPFR